MTEPTHWRSIWISDVHLGTRHAQVPALLEFLRQNESDYLYIVGDLVDGWEFRHRWAWNDDHNTLIQKLLRKQRKGTRITYVTGNHDEFLEPFIGLHFGGLQLARDAVHIAADGRRFLIIHGHQLDGLTQYNRALEHVGARLYDWILELNLWLNRARRRFGLGYWSVSAFLKHRAKLAVQFVTQFETAMTRVAESRDVHGVICGHIHRAEIRRIGALEYMNCGDWVESCTALAEDEDGQFHLIHFHENSLHRAGRGPRAYDAGARRAEDAATVGA